MLRNGLILKLKHTQLSLFDQQGTVKQLVIMVFAEAEYRDDLIEKLCQNNYTIELFYMKR